MPFTLTPAPVGAPADDRSAGPAIDAPGGSAPAVIRRAGEADRVVLESLWQLFRHHMSTYSGVLPGPDGRYGQSRLEAALTQEGQRAWLVESEGHPVGFALTRGHGTPVRVVTAFFVVAAMRRRGIARACIETVLDSDPGCWTAAFQTANLASAAFWQDLAQRHDPGWTVERADVPGRPDLVPDNWVRFTVDAD